MTPNSWRSTWREFRRSYKAANPTWLAQLGGMLIALFTEGTEFDAIPMPIKLAFLLSVAEQSIQKKGAAKEFQLWSRALSLMMGDNFWQPQRHNVVFRPPYLKTQRCIRLFELLSKPDIYRAGLGRVPYNEKVQRLLSYYVNWWEFENKGQPLPRAWMTAVVASDNLDMLGLVRKDPRSAGVLFEWLTAYLQQAKRNSEQRMPSLALLCRATILGAYTPLPHDVAKQLGFHLMSLDLINDSQILLQLTGAGAFR